MNLTPKDVEELGFENFYALKLIMAVSLTSLSQETHKQQERISALEKEERVLKNDLESLAKIEVENQRKEEMLNREYEELDRKNNSRLIKGGDTSENDGDFGDI